MVFYSLADSGTLCRWSSISVDAVGSTRPLLLDGYVYVHMHTSYILQLQRKLVNLCGTHPPGLGPRLVQIIRWISGIIVLVGDIC